MNLHLHKRSLCLTWVRSRPVTASGPRTIPRSLPPERVSILSNISRLPVGTHGEDLMCSVPIGPALLWRTCWFDSPLKAPHSPLDVATADAASDTTSAPDSLMMEEREQVVEGSDVELGLLKRRCARIPFRQFIQLAHVMIGTEWLSTWAPTSALGLPLQHFSQSFFFDPLKTNFVNSLLIL